MEHVREVVRAQTPWAVRIDSPDKPTLSPQLIDAAVTRLRWVSLSCAVLVTMLIVLEGRLQPEMNRLFLGPVLPWVWLSVIASSLGVVAVQHYRLISPMAILKLALVFEVVVAAAISFSETALPMFGDRPVLGASKVALWIVIVGLLIPNRPAVQFMTALVSASTWPVAYALNIYLHGYEVLPLNRLVMWVYLPYLTACVGFVISKRMYRMETAVQTARDLGSYHLVSLIGTGGMGEVWRARHRMLPRDAAIKLIRADLLMLQPGYASDIARKRFSLEAQAIASLQSPHTVFLYDFGISEDGSFYYVMELLDGISLQVLVNRFGPQPAARVIHILRQVCGSLEEAHRRGLVHRDIKPNNVFACMVGLEYDFMKVLDFGLVKNVAHKGSVDLTAVGATAGTPAYMAPEVALGKERLDGRADIYSLGCVAYFLLTGSPVFGEKAVTAMLMAQVRHHPIPPSQRTEMPIPPRLEEIVMRCLAKQPEDRPRSAQELSRLLGSIADVPEWTQENASEWWRTYLPSSSAFRTARQPRADIAESRPLGAAWIAR